jgi:hypothetical protein
VHKDRISRGDVVIRKDVFSENQTVQVPLLHLDFLHVDLVEFIAPGNSRFRLGGTKQDGEPLIANQEMKIAD